MMDPKNAEWLMNLTMKKTYLVVSIVHHGVFFVVMAAFFLFGLQEHGVAEYFFRTAALSYPVSLQAAYFLKVMEMAWQASKWGDELDRMQGKNRESLLFKLFEFAWTLKKHAYWFLVILGEGAVLWTARALVARFLPAAAFLAWVYLVVKMAVLLVWTIGVVKKSNQVTEGIHKILNAYQGDKESWKL